MNKIKSLKISGIRGIKDTLHLQLDEKSALVYGENGSGKSSITDCLEWFYFDRIEHLKSEEIAKKKGIGALRNAQLPESVDSCVEIEYTKSEFNTKKTVSAAYEISFSNPGDTFRSFMSGSKTETLLLRCQDLIRFVIASKRERLDELQKIIGFGEVGDLRSQLAKLASYYSREIKKADFNNEKSRQQSIILKNLGQNITNKRQFIEVANELLRPLKLNMDICSLKVILEILENMGEGDEAEIIEKIIFLKKVSESFNAISGRIGQIHSGYENYYAEYAKLRQDPQKIVKLGLLTLLKEGVKVLKSDLPGEECCPLCLQRKGRLDLLEELRKRIEDLNTLESEKAILEQKRRELQDMIQSTFDIVNGMTRERLISEPENQDLLDKLIEARKALERMRNELKKDIMAPGGITEPVKVVINHEMLIEASQQLVKNAKELEDRQKGSTKFRLHYTLKSAIDAFSQYKKIEKKEAILLRQQRTFETLLAELIKRQEKAIKEFLDRFSYEINEFYTMMNPGEAIANIRLVPLVIEDADLVGITLEYDLFEQPKSPPSAYMSESHLNSLGLSFFLASAKAFNKNNRFLLLDDVASGFDGHHKARFFKMMAEKFFGHQVLLFTHEKEFFNEIAAEARGKGWLLGELSSADVYGTKLVSLK